jgi:hypothetical protein
MCVKLVTYQNYTGFIVEVNAKDYFPIMSYVSQLGLKHYMKLP